MRSLMLCVLLGILTPSTSIPNFSGKWIVEGTNRGPTRQATTLILNHASKEVTGSISSRIDEGSASPVYTEILDGKVEGDTITFYVWTGLDRPVKAYYEGVLSGEEIKFTVTGGAAESGGLAGPGAGAGQSARRQVTAKRAK